MKSFSLANCAKKYAYREDGALVYKDNYKNNKQGAVAGYIDTSTGYVRVSMGKNKKEYAHRIVWYIHNEETADYVDHINGCRHDNRIENLRSCTQLENTRNRHNAPERVHKLPRNVYRQANNQFRVAMTINNVYKHIGSFSSLEEATEQAKKAREEYYGNFEGKETTKDFCGTSKRLSDVTETNSSD